MPKANDFWSRRRRSVAAEEDDLARREDEAEHKAAEAELEEVDDETLLQMLGLPDPETLTPADAARFMAREVPGRLRKRALRALFRGHPGLSLPDGLNDYDEDYVNAPLAPRSLRPVWTAVRRFADTFPAEADGPAPAAVETQCEEAPAEEAPEDPAIEDHAPDLDEQPLRPRRMTFRFEEEDT
ncbi:DUF3306 domain-containing protein [Palleronia sp.]|uniref:DUF3306 domain-containing protein n=1 Tax=Palleronia sp. TaxID=1940284 RepID=UPI0035C83E2A